MRGLGTRRPAACYRCTLLIRVHLQVHSTVFRSRHYRSGVSITRQLQPLSLSAELPVLTAALIDIPSESHDEEQIASLVEQALRAYSHLSVTRIGNSVIATNHADRGDRIVLAGHLDTVPANGNLPHHVESERIYGLGAADMKGGVAIALHLAATVTDPVCDVTYIFYESEEVSSEFNGLLKISQISPEFLEADFAVLMEPSNASPLVANGHTAREAGWAKTQSTKRVRSWKF